MKNSIILTIGILFVNISIGQEIELKLNILGCPFVQNGENPNWFELIKATASVPEAR
ncbi:hypothetical protein Q2T41_06970 [Maribacter confluentis]|uniref:Uncharacterized protein n=1 Tax=Maribacter confluentis TaxID=1656093 RepID=A0ABT8RNE2_9FLAO|nr:hypothetical protein [Maribacter confluentis]MDO1512391.1 hypothetical protein [Maribacter confluentis]